MENQEQINSEALNFDFPTTDENHSIIKVIGVGGGGSNAVQHMFETGIKDVSFLIINTDKQALNGSLIPNKLLISDRGLGAGARPEIAREFAVQYTEEIRQAISDGTEMVFITAGMGGGTGTGAAPVVAQIAHEMGILTIGIVTIPFRFEGRKKIMMALEGVRAIERWCDALLVVNNNRLIDVYPDLSFSNAFGKADDTLTTAAKSISDIINIQGYINLDFADVKTTLSNGGVALISTGQTAGEDRLSKAIEAAITSPLLQDNNINDAKHLLFELCFSHQNPLTMAEIDEMNRFVDSLNSDIEVIWGAMFDDTLGDEVRIILLASGFAMDHSTGGVIANNNMGDKIKDMERELRYRITEKQALLSEFDGFPEASGILLNAIRLAKNKADNMTLETDVEEESAKLNKALEDARENKKQKIAEQEAAEEAARKAAEEKQAILDQIARLQQQLAANDNQQAATVSPEPEKDEAPKAVEQPAPADPIAEAQKRFEQRKQAEALAAQTAQTAQPAQTDTQQPEVKAGQDAAATQTQSQTPEQTNAQEGVKAETKVEAEPEGKNVAEPVAKVEQKSEVKVEQKPTTKVESSTEVKVEPKKPEAKPQTDTQKGLEEIRRFYGDEYANKAMLDKVRKTYYVLDDQELTNQQLIELLEKLPAYNRTLEDFGQLKAVSRTPATPKVIGHPDNHPDGTIKF